MKYNQSYYMKLKYDNRFLITVKSIDGNKLNNVGFVILHFSQVLNHFLSVKCLSINHEC